jgi:hypothetical protein
MLDKGAGIGGMPVQQQTAKESPSNALIAGALLAQFAENELGEARTAQACGDTNTAGLVDAVDLKYKKTNLPAIRQQNFNATRRMWKKVSRSQAM